LCADLLYNYVKTGTVVVVVVVAALFMLWLLLVVEKVWVIVGMALVRALRCSHTIAYALRMQILESVCKFHAQLLTPPLNYMP